MNKNVAIIAIVSAISLSLWASLQCGFVVDLSPPFIVPESAFPPADTIMTDYDLTISFELEDFGAGVWSDSVITRLIVNNTDTAEYYATFAIHREFLPSDTVEVCIYAVDMIFDTLDCTCPANILDTCWTFYIEGACSTWFDSIWFWQEDFCDDENRVQICYRLESTCDGPWDIDLFASADGGASWDISLSSLIGEAGHLGTVADTGLHCFEWLLSADLPDLETCEFAIMLDGDSILSPAVADGCLDSRPPRVSIDCPITSLRAGESSFINWSIDDSFFFDYPCTLHFFSELCGINETYAISDYGFIWSTPLIDCPSCTLIIAVRDSMCNWGYDTCEFEILIPCDAGPFAEVVYPDSCGYITSCVDQGAAWVISDTTGFALDTTSFEVRVEVSGRSEPVDTVLTIVSPALIWDGVSRLEFEPSAIGMEFASWDTVTVTLISADNEVGCALDEPVSCRFIVDLDPPVVLGGFLPPPGTVFYEIPAIFTPEISIHDSITERAQFAQIVEHWRGGGIIWSDSTLWGTLIDLEVEDNDSIRICAVNISDSPDYDYCPPNTAPDTCWWVYVLLCDAVPFAEVVYPDSCGYITSCADQAVAWVIFDTTHYDIDTTSFEVRLQVSGRSEPVDTVFTIESPALTWVGDSLLGFDPSSIGMEFESWDTVTVTLISARNEVGCLLESPVLCWFVVDLDPPVVLGGFSPPPGTLFYETPAIFTPEISFHDSITEIADFAQFLELWRGGSVIWSDSSHWGTSIDLEVEDGDSIRICAIEISDVPGYDYCPPNTAPDTCWWVYVSLMDTIPPRAWVLEPIDLNGDGDTISACPCQQIVFRISSEHSIMPESTVVQIGADVHSFDPSWMVFSDGFDSLTLDPTFIDCWEGLAFADYALLDLVDSIGAHIADIVRGGFIIDSEPPEINMLTPDTLTVEVSAISFEAIDAFCGSSLIDSITIERNGIHDTTAHSADSIVLRDLTDGDSLFVCIFAHDDCADYCGPNFAIQCWDIFAAIEVPDTSDTIPPTAVLLHPFEGGISACSLQTVYWALSDDHSGIDIDRIWVSVNSEVIRISDPELELILGDTLIFSPSIYWPEGTHSACLDSIFDLAGNPSVTPICTEFTIDYTPPAINFISPTCSSEIHETWFDVVVNIFDEVSPIFYYESWIIFGTDSIPFTDTEMTITPEILDTIWRDGDTVSFCVSARDSTDYCSGDNINFECCEFYIVLGELNAEAVFPDNNTITSCSLQTAQWAFEGELELSSIRISLNIAEDFLWPCVELEFSGDTLTFIPSTPWENGDSVELCIVHAENIHGVRLDDTVCVFWINDIEPPAFTGLSPAPESSIATTSPTISIIVFDEVVGVDIDSTLMEIDGVPVSTAFSGDTLRFDTVGSGMSWLGGDTVSVCVRTQDLARYCGANKDTICWRFFIADGGPEIIAIHPPEDSLWSACEGQGALFYLFDPDGIDTMSIELTVNGSISDAWVYRDDSIRYEPVFGPLDSDTVTVCATALDMLGNPSDSTACITYFMDFSPPEIISIDPLSGTGVDANFSLTIELADRGSGINESSIQIDANGMLFDISDEALSWDGNILHVDFPVPFAYGETVRVCIDSLSDSPDICAPNSLDSCWEYSISVLPDLWTSSAHLSLIPNALVYGDSFVFEGIGFYDGVEVLPRIIVEITSGMGVLRRVEYTNLSPEDTIHETISIIAEGADFYDEILPICLKLDTDNDVIESNENNNQACLTLTILSSDCGATPNPFSPNADGKNDLAYFTYPGQGTQPATIEIYDFSGRLVTQLDNIAFWDGNDSAENPQPKGIYVYIITRGGEILCKGIIHIAR